MWKRKKGKRVKKVESRDYDDDDDDENVDYAYQEYLSEAEDDDF